MNIGSNRPQSLAQVAVRAAQGAQLFDAAVREFLDSWQSIPKSAKVRAIAEVPCYAGRVQDAYLGALAEHLAILDRLPAPAWCEEPRRFLNDPFFSGGLESLKAILLVESPPAFRRRLIFISADALSRPRREFIEENALSVQNLDV